MILLALPVAGLTIAAAQTRRNSRPATKKTNQTTAKPADAGMLSKPEPTPTPAAKRNERPGGNAAASSVVQSTAGESKKQTDPAYRYEFSQPDFVVPSIKVEHDDAGTGSITFSKKDADEKITDPIKVSARALARINDALTALNFLDSSENYQYEKDFSHLGVVKFRLSRKGKTRDVTLNWTENKDAKILMTEYRRIANQYIWIFDISLSRDNQPLESPRLMDSLDGMIRRNDISDAYQLEPFLRELAEDERIPLIARNHASRLVKQFEKDRAKEEKKKAGTN